MRIPSVTQIFLVHSSRMERLTANEEGAPICLSEKPEKMKLMEEFFATI